MTATLNARDLLIAVAFTIVANVAFLSAALHYAA